MFGFIMAFILAGTVFLIIGLLFKKNRNDKEYVGVVKTTIGYVLLIYVGIPLFLFCFVVGGVLYNISKDTDSSSTADSTENSKGAIRRADNDRLITGDEQREIFDKIASGMSPEQVVQSMSAKSVDANQKNSAGNGEDSLGDVYKDDDKKFSVKFPLGWKVGRPKKQSDGDIAAFNNEGDSFIRIARLDHQSKTPISKNVADELALGMLETVHRDYPNAEIFKADTIEIFSNSGNKFGIYAIVKVNDKRFWMVVKVPIKSHLYHIDCGGNNASFDTVITSIGTFDVME